MSKIVVVVLLGMAIFSTLAVAQKRSPAVAAAVAPEWPSGENPKAPFTKVVKVGVETDGFGNVVDAKVIEGGEGSFQSEALEAARDWKFGPNVRVGDHASLMFIFRALPKNASVHELRTRYVQPYSMTVSKRSELP